MQHSIECGTTNRRRRRRRESVSSNNVQKAEKPKKILKCFFDSKTKLFRFISVYAFSIGHPKFLCLGSSYIFNFFCLKGCAKVQGTKEFFFKLSFIFIMYTDTYVIRAPSFEVFEVINLVMPFLRLRSKNFKKKWLSGTVHPGMVS